MPIDKGREKKKPISENKEYAITPNERISKTGKRKTIRDVKIPLNESVSAST